MKSLLNGREKRKIQLIFLFFLIFNIGNYIFLSWDYCKTQQKCHCERPKGAWPRPWRGFVTSFLAKTHKWHFATVPSPVSFFLKGERKTNSFSFFWGERFFFSGIAFADEKQWAGVDDGVTWENALNWFAPVIPTANDDVIINMKDAEVLASKNFFAKTLNIGGREESSFTANDFIYGIIGPDRNTDEALYIKKDGMIIFKGAGDVVLKGSFKNSEETLPSEPAFMFGLE